MAEARTGDEEESLRETRESGGAGSRRNPRSSSAAAERAERNKPEQRHSTQGALSSIRAAIKRTSTRTAPTEQNRDRRRPQITIVAAEPLASNTWFPGSPGAFPPPPPPPAQPSWSGPLTVELPPPSYDQVIKEKSREQNPPTPSVSSSPSSTLSSTSSSSSSSTACTTVTIATQTDPEAYEPQSLTKPPMRRPPKPPRPSLPFTPKRAEPAPVCTLIDLDEPDPPCASQTSSHLPLSEHSANQTDSTVHLTAALTPTLADPSQITQTSPLQCTAKQEASVPPRPRPRSRALLQPVIREEGQDQQMTRDVRVQTLVRLKDDPAESVFAGFGDGSLDITSNKYLQELLDVFGGDEQVCQGDQGTKSDQSEEEEEDSSESLFAPVASEPLEILIRPEPRPRTRNPKPLILPKPSHLSQDVQEHKDSSEDNKQTTSPPAPAPRPLLSKTSASQQHGNKTEPSRLPPPPRPPPLSRRSGTPTQAEGDVLDCQAGKSNADDQDRISPLPPPKPAPVTATARSGQKCPAKPPTQRRPPLPTHTPIQDDVSAVSLTKAAASSVPSLPPRPSESRLLPLRPPPVKVTKPGGSSQPPAPTSQLPGSRVPKRGPPLPPRPKPGHPLYREKTSKATQGNAKVIRPNTEPEEPHLQKEDLLVVFDDWPTPSSSEKNHNQNEPSSTSEHSQEPKIQEPKEEQQAKQQPELNTTVRYVARFAFQGEDGELTFQEGDVITLIERVNEEWGRGSLDGRTGIFPLSFVQGEALVLKSSTPELAVPPAGKGQTGKVLYDFSPESEDELPLKAGDVVCYLEALDEEWFVAEFAGRRGIVPKNFVQVLQEPKAQS